VLLQELEYHNALWFLLTAQSVQFLLAAQCVQFLLAARCVQFLSFFWLLGVCSFFWLLGGFYMFSGRSASELFIVVKLFRLFRRCSGCSVRFRKSVSSKRSGKD